MNYRYTGQDILAKVKELGHVLLKGGSGVLLLSLPERGDNLMFGVEHYADGTAKYPRLFQGFCPKKNSLVDVVFGEAEKYDIWTTPNGGRIESSEGKLVFVDFIPETTLAGKEVQFLNNSNKRVEGKWVLTQCPGLGWVVRRKGDNATARINANGAYFAELVVGEKTYRIRAGA